MPQFINNAGESFALHARLFKRACGSIFNSGPGRSQTLNLTLFAAIAAFDELRTDGQRAEALAALDDIALLL